MRIALLCLLTFLWACRSESPNLGFQVRDSAGISIAESARPAWKSGEGWSISAAPVLQIGVQDGDPIYQFFRVTAARWLPAGRIAVANSGSKTIRLYDERGRFLREVGGEGDGPGEFRWISTLERFGGDSLAAYDQRSMRVSVFTAVGDFVRTLRLRQPGPELLFGPFPLTDGTLVVGTSWSSAMLAGDFSVGVHRSPQPVFRYTASGELLDTIGLFPGYEMYVGQDHSIAPAPFGHITTLDVHDDLVYVGTGDRLEIRVHSPEGDLERIIRGPELDLSISEEDIAAYRERRHTGVSDPNKRARITARLNELEYPEYRPAYGQILVDVAGNVWASRYGVRPVSSIWIVFDSAGRLLGEVRLPDRFRVLDIMDQHIPGVWQDQSDVEYVQMYDILK